MSIKSFIKKAIPALLTTSMLISSSVGPISEKINVFNTSITASAAGPDVAYRGHIQNIGDVSAVYNGAVLGTTGRSLRLEQLGIKISGINGGIAASAHLQDIGWTAEKYANAGSYCYIGSRGESRRMECVKLRLTGEAANQYSILYRAHVQNLGWLDWSRDGQECGTVSRSLRIEAIEIKLERKSGVDAKINAFLSDSRWRVGTSWGGSQTPKLSGHKSWGCCAYAWDFAQYVYSKGVTSGSKFTSASQIRKGDILYLTPQHWMIVLNRVGNTLDILHGNWTQNKVCRNSFTLNGNRISNKTFSYGYHFI